MVNFFEFKNLYRRFDINDRYIMESGSVEPGHILAIRGPSGSGKSTLLRMLARLVIPESGEVIYHGQSWKTISPVEWRTKVHYVSQKPVMFAGTLNDNFKIPFIVSGIMQKRSFPDKKINKYMEELALPSGMLAQEAQTLSGGEAARAALIRALLVEPEILLLDEPTAYLDDDSRVRVISLLNNWLSEGEKRAIIMVSHNDEDMGELKNTTVLTVNPGKADE